MCLAFSHPRSPEVSERHGAPIIGPGLGVGRQEEGREEGNPLGRPGVKHLPQPPKTTHSYNQPGRFAQGPFNSNISLKKKKILIWSFSCFQSGQGAKEREESKMSPQTPECAGAIWQCHPASFESGSLAGLLQGQRLLSSHDPEKTCG